MTTRRASKPKPRKSAAGKRGALTPQQKAAKTRKRNAREKEKARAKRSAASKRGWETRRRTAAETRSQKRARFPITPPPLEPQAQETLQQAWARWAMQCERVVPGIMVNFQEWLDAGISPWGTEPVGADQLFIYVGKEARAQFDALQADGTVDAIIRAWADTGEMPVEAVDVGFRWEVRHLYRTPFKLQDAVFTTDMVGVVAVRGNGGLTNAGRGHFELMWRQGEWLEVKRKRKQWKKPKANG